MSHYLKIKTQFQASCNHTLQKIGWLISLNYFQYFSDTNDYKREVGCRMIHSDGSSTLVAPHECGHVHMLIKAPMHVPNMNIAGIQEMRVLLLVCIAAWCSPLST